MKVTAALAIGAAVAPATALADVAVVADWEAASARVGVPLLAPTQLAGHDLVRLRVRTLTCFGRAIDFEVDAAYERPDGSRVSFIQSHPYDCREGGDFEDLGDRVIDGRTVSFNGFVNLRETCWSGPEAVCTDGGANQLMATFNEGDDALTVLANHGITSGVESMLTGLRTVEPPAGSQPVVRILPVRIAAVLRPDRIRVRSANRVLTLRLAGITSPRPGQCGYTQAPRYTRAFARKGTDMLVEIDPVIGIGGRAPVGTLWRKNRSVTYSLNTELAGRGLAKITGTPNRYQTPLARSSRAARTDDRGIWGTLCAPTSSIGRPPSPPRPTSPTRPGASPVPGDIYNCGDFPLSDGTTAAEYLRRYPSDPSRLDSDGDGRACE
jgi:endonuclease YncB( thermonuclease family)